MEKLPPSGVDIFLLKEMENLVSDILASDAFILSDFKFNIIDRLEDRHYREADKVERLEDISDDISNDKDSFEYKCRIEERNIIGRAKGEEAEKLRGQVDKLQAFMQGELKKDDAIGQYFRLQRRCSSLLRAVRWLEERRKINLYRPWRHRFTVNEKYVYDSDIWGRAQLAASDFLLPVESIDLRDWLMFYLGAIDVLTRKIEEERSSCK